LEKLEFILARLHDVQAVMQVIVPSPVLFLVSLVGSKYRALRTVVRPRGLPKLVLLDCNDGKEK
jgi:hypothetical protein